MWGSKQILGDQQINCLRLLDLKELRLDSNDLQGQATQHLKYPPQIAWGHKFEEIKFQQTKHMCGF